MATNNLHLQDRYPQEPGDPTAGEKGKTKTYPGGRLIFANGVLEKSFCPSDLSHQCYQVTSGSYFHLLESTQEQLAALWAVIQFCSQSSFQMVCSSGAPCSPWRTYDKGPLIPFPLICFLHPSLALRSSDFLCLLQGLKL